MTDLTFDSLDQIPEDLRSDAKEVEGKVVLSVAPKSKLTEFRDNNINLAKERDSLNERLQSFQSLVGDDPNEFQKELEELRTVNKRVQDGELVASTSLESALEARTKELKSDLTGKIDSLQKDRDAWQEKAQAVDEQFQVSLVDRALTDAVLDSKSGARPEALSDILERGRKVFQVTEDRQQIIPKEKNASGETQVMYGPDGATPMSPSQWLNKLKEQAPYFFQGSSGGGATGSPAGASGTFTDEQIAQMDMATYAKHRKAGKIR